ncbi:hypothetical protein GW17_00046914, partial [Ensete ventricosum]
ILVTKDRIGHSFLHLLLALALEARYPGIEVEMEQQEDGRASQVVVHQTPCPIAVAQLTTLLRRYTLLASYRCTDARQGLHLYGKRGAKQLTELRG